MSDYQCRVSAVLDDGGTVTTTMSNYEDAVHRYEWFRGQTDRPPAFVGLFVRQPDGKLAVDRMASNDSPGPK